MKISKAIVLLIASMFILLSFTGCRCEPSTVDWHLFSYKTSMTFMGGVVRELGFSDASIAYPFAGVENSNIGISFSSDGTVVFTTRDGVTLRGTYTYEHVKINYTDFTITLENGEKIEGSSIKTLKEKKLSLEYNGVIYNFTDTNKRQYVSMESVIKRISSGNHDSLHEVNVEKVDGNYSVRFSEYISYPIKEDTAVFAMRIYRDGSYEILDALCEGEALSTYNDSANYIVIYYVE